MDLLSDAGHPLPAVLADLDQLTAYGTLFRYEDMPEDTPLDRSAALTMVKTQRVFVEAKIGAR